MHQRTAHGLGSVGGSPENRPPALPHVRFDAPGRAQAFSGYLNSGVPGPLGQVYVRGVALRRLGPCLLVVRDVCVAQNRPATSTAWRGRLCALAQVRRR